MTGSTWVKLTTTLRLALRTHSSARMTKLATGMARMSCMTGSTIARATRQRLDSAPSATPVTTASTNPSRIRPAVNSTRRQNPAVGSNAASAPRVCPGVARNSPP